MSMSCDFTCRIVLADTRFVRECARHTEHPIHALAQVLVSERGGSILSPAQRQKPIVKEHPNKKLKSVAPKLWSPGVGRPQPK